MVLPLPANLGKLASKAACAYCHKVEPPNIANGSSFKPRTIVSVNPMDRELFKVLRNLHESDKPAAKILICDKELRETISNFVT